MPPSSSYWCRHHPSSIATGLISLLLVSAILPVVLAEAAPEECNLPLDTGNGGFPVLRYFYSSVTGECVSFQYWSTGGNDNNFATFADCEDTCMSSSASQPTVATAQPNLPTTQPTLATTQPTLATTQPTLATTPTELDPESPTAIATETSPSPITTEATTEAPSEYPTEICHLPMENGICRDIFLDTRYWYNKDTNNCESFNFFSCHGNENNFASYEDCMNTCEVIASSPAPGPAPTSNSDTPPTSEICHLPMENGICPFIFLDTRYWYNKDTNNCESFDFFSCHGNENNFASYEECMDTCEVIASSPAPDPAPTSNSDTPPASPSPTQTSEVPAVAMETTVPPPASSSSSVQPHPPQNTAIVRPPPSPTPLNFPTVNKPTDTTTTPTGPGTIAGFPDFIFPGYPGPTEDSGDGQDSEDTSPSGSAPSQSHSRTISAFDIASIAVGVVALLLVVVLVTIVALLVCRHRQSSGRLQAVQCKKYVVSSRRCFKQNSYDSKSSFA